MNKWGAAASGSKGARDWGSRDWRSGSSDDGANPLVRDADTDDVVPLKPRSLQCEPLVAPRSRGLLQVPRA
ncbi:hypothetical protein GCM10010464_53720 [Pseudonocardia yunnanensis]